jgi:hypothetical protein
VKQEFFSFDGWIDLDLIIYNFSFCLKFHPDTTSPYELIGELALFMVESIQKEKVCERKHWQLFVVTFSLLELAKQGSHLRLLSLALKELQEKQPRFEREILGEFVKYGFDPKEVDLSRVIRNSAKPL